MQNVNQYPSKKSLSGLIVYKILKERGHLESNTHSNTTFSPIRVKIISKIKKMGEQ